VRILILGADGYIGYPLSQRLVALGHEVWGVDNGLRRRCVEAVGGHSGVPIIPFVDRGREIGAEFVEVDLQASTVIPGIFHDFEPESVVNLAQVPSAPYSMISQDRCNETQINNLLTTNNLLWTLRDWDKVVPVVTLGTMGEYLCTPEGMPIPEGWGDMTFRGITARVPFPRMGGSFYHQSKIAASKNIEFACKIWPHLRYTDINQGVVYGTLTDDMGGDPARRTRFDYEGVFGTVINRYVAQAICGLPMSPFGAGHQKRGFIALRDSIQALVLALMQPPPEEQSYRIINQWDEVYEITELAGRVIKKAKEIGLSPTVENIPNPRVELEVHPYHPDHDELLKLGFKATHTLDQELEVMLKDLIQFKTRIKEREAAVAPLVSWTIK